MSQGLFFIISAPSGTGKSTIINILLKDKTLNLKKPLSFTTRLPREGEKQSKHYQFISIKEFENLIKENKLLEWAKVHNNFYGTSDEQVKKTLSQGQNLIKDIDTQGALILQKKLKEKAILIFISPPSINDLKKRLLKRKTDSLDTINLRLKNAKEELKNTHLYHFNVINKDIDNAVLKIKEIIKGFKNVTT